MGWLLDKLDARGYDTSLPDFDERLGEATVGRYLKWLETLDDLLGDFVTGTYPTVPLAQRWLVLLGPLDDPETRLHFLDDDDLDFCLQIWRLVRPAHRDLFTKGKASRHWPLVFLAAASRCAALCYRSGALWEYVLPGVFSASRDRRANVNVMYSAIKGISRVIDKSKEWPHSLVSQSTTEHQGHWKIRWVLGHAGLPEPSIREVARVCDRLYELHGTELGSCDAETWRDLIDARHPSAPVRHFLEIAPPKDHLVVREILALIEGRHAGEAHPLALRIFTAIERRRGDRAILELSRERGRWNLSLKRRGSGVTAGQRGVWTVRVTDHAGQEWLERRAGFRDRLPQIEVGLDTLPPQLLRLALDFVPSGSEEATLLYDWDLVVASHMTGELAGEPVFRLRRKDPLRLAFSARPTERALTPRKDPSVSQLKLPSEEMAELAFPRHLVEAITNRGGRTVRGTLIDASDVTPAPEGFDRDFVSAEILIPFQERFSRWLARPETSLQPVGAGITSHLGCAITPRSGMWFLRYDGESAEVSFDVRGMRSPDERAAHEVQIDVAGQSHAAQLDGRARVRLTVRAEPFSYLTAKLVRTMPPEAIPEEATKEDDEAEADEAAEFDLSFEPEVVDEIYVFLVPASEGIPELSPSVAVGNEVQRPVWQAHSAEIKVDADALEIAHVSTHGECLTKLPWLEARIRASVHVRRNILGAAERHDVAHIGQIIPVPATDSARASIEIADCPFAYDLFWLGQDGSETELQGDKNGRSDVTLPGQLAVRDRSGAETVICTVAPHWQMNWSESEEQQIAWSTEGPQPAGACFLAMEVLSLSGPIEIALDEETRSLAIDDLISRFSSQDKGVYLLDPQIRYRGSYVARPVGAADELTRRLVVSTDDMELDAVLQALRTRTNNSNDDDSIFAAALLREVRDCERLARPTELEATIAGSAEDAATITVQGESSAPGVAPRAEFEVHAPWSDDKSAIGCYVQARRLRLPHLSTAMMSAFGWRDPGTRLQIDSPNRDALLELGLAAAAKNFAGPHDDDPDACLYRGLSFDAMRLDTSLEWIEGRVTEKRPAIPPPRPLLVAQKIGPARGPSLDKLCDALDLVGAAHDGHPVEKELLLGAPGRPGLLDRLETGRLRATLDGSPPADEHFWGMIASCTVGLSNEEKIDSVLRRSLMDRKVSWLRGDFLERCAPAIEKQFRTLLAPLFKRVAWLGAIGPERLIEAHRERWVERLSGGERHRVDVTVLHDHLPSHNCPQPEVVLLRVLPLRMLTAALVQRFAPYARLWSALSEEEVESLLPLLNPDSAENPRAALGILFATSTFMFDFRPLVARGARRDRVAGATPQLFVSYLRLADQLVRAAFPRETS